MNRQAGAPVPRVLDGFTDPLRNPNARRMCRIQGRLWAVRIALLLWMSVAGIGQTVSGQTVPAQKTEAQLGAELTQQGRLEEAIPHLLLALQANGDTYGAGVNLGICYLKLGRYKEAIGALQRAVTEEKSGAVGENLLAQAYLGDGEVGMAWSTFAQAAAKAPRDEKLYDFVCDASTDHRQYEFGLRVAEAGLRQLPDSARLHYERGLFLARLDRLEEGRPEFDRAAQLAKDGYLGTLAQVQKDLYDENFPGATELLRAAVKAGNREYQTLSLLGTVLLQDGAAPGDARFAEAEAALEEAEREHPNYSATEIALGRMYLAEGRYADARDRLEAGRRLEPENPAVYTNLAQAYQRLGDKEHARAMQAELARLLEEKQGKPRATAKE